MNNAQETVAQNLSQSSALTTTASLSEFGRSLSADFLCYNANVLLFDSWTEPALVKAVKQLKPRVLRFPGGTVSDFWDWQRGGIMEDLSEVNPRQLPGILRNQRVRQYTASKLEDFKAGLTATQTKPLFVLNILTSDLNSQLAMLRKARDLGIPVEYVQIGNEAYFNLPDNLERFPTPDDYAKFASQWSDAIKKEFPKAKVAVIGASQTYIERGNERIRFWNDSVLKTALPKSDAIAFHLYYDTNIIPPSSSATSYPFFTQEDVPIILNLPFLNWRKMRENQQFKAVPDQKEIWITEYNVMEPLQGQGSSGPKIIGSWAHGLQNIALSLLFLEDKRINRICNHVLVGTSQFGAILADEKQIGIGTFINPSEKVKAEPFSLSASGSALKLLGEATENMTQAKQINFSSNPMVTGKNQAQYPSLSGWLFSNGEENRAVILNLSSEVVQVNFDSIFPKSVDYEQVSGNPRDLVSKSGILTESQGTTSKKIQLPAYSVTKLSSLK
ncbi:hypothetical protein [Crocosphaera sp. UHCC 0190]|uniref:hypothetical protein n=1 Tax=Crocosphaera sp. UHCC 0190 TaxID=3110246 RepID=UPI002B1FE4BB|nr:hypothetical protein [Crocosphaera sp. UHCC 0190]